MVSSLLHGLTNACMGKPFIEKLLFPLNPVNVVSSDDVELDFSDIFGPVPVEEKSVESERIEHLYDDPVAICRRTHSLVGPSTCVSQSLKLSKLTLSEEDTVELAGCASDGGIVEEHLEKPTQSIGIEDFEVMKVVGQGAFGKVYQVRMKGSTEIYAMKVIRKDKIMEKNHAEYMKAERDILTIIDHPFIVQLRYSFQSKYRLYLVLDFINGGHLFFQLYHHGLFREDLARIYAAEIVSAVSHLHANGIMHRDLKPENILLDADGHAMLTDFGLAKQFDENTRSNSMCGTLEYMPPEIVLGKGHGKAADWWSFGILLFEMLSGKPPFPGRNRHKVQQKIIKDRIKLPAFLSSEAHSLLKGLLQKDANNRLGSGVTGSQDIKCHKWFKAINWKKLEGREVEPSFRPSVSGKHCVANFEKRWTEMPLLDSPASSPKLEGGTLFQGFTYARPPAPFPQSE